MPKAAVPSPTQGDQEFVARLRRFVRSRVPASDADDVLQQIELKLIEHGASASNLSLFIHRVAKNAIADYYRRRATRTSREVPSLAPDEEGIATDLEGDEGQAAIDVASWVRPFLSTLPADLAQAIDLTDFEGLSHAAAATRLGIPRSTLSSRVQKGRAMLREQIERCCRIELDARRRVVGWEPREACGCASPSSGEGSSAQGCRGR